MADRRQHKGTGVIPLLAAIKARPALVASLPDHLQTYLEMPILPSGWYPEDDYHDLITTLARAVTPEVPDDLDVWHVFGVLGARRDVAGNEQDVPEDSRVKSVGIYRRFSPGAGADLSDLFLRLQKLWTLYHDSGEMRIVYDTNWGPKVRAELKDFGFPERGVLQLQISYAVEYAKLGGFEIQGRIVAYGGRSDTALHIWEYQVADTPGNLAALERLPRPA